MLSEEFLYVYAALILTFTGANSAAAAPAINGQYAIFFIVKEGVGGEREGERK